MQRNSENQFATSVGLWLQLALWRAMENDMVQHPLRKRKLVQTMSVKTFKMHQHVWHCKTLGTAPLDLSMRGSSRRWWTLRLLNMMWKRSHQLEHDSAHCGIQPCIDTSYILNTRIPLAQNQNQIPAPGVSQRQWLWHQSFWTWSRAPWLRGGWVEW